MRECFGKIRVSTLKPLRYTNIACLFCVDNYSCATVSGTFIPVDAASFAVRLIFSELNRKQVQSYIRDHYRLADVTARDVAIKALERIREFYDIMQPYKKPPVIALKRLLWGHLPKDIARFLVTLNSRHTICFPFVNEGDHLDSLSGHFKYSFGYDDHPVGKTVGMESKEHVSNLTFYPIMFSRTHERHYSVVFVDTRRCFETEYLKYLNSIVEQKARPLFHKTLEELLLDDFSSRWARVVPLEEVIKYYTRGKISNFLLWAPRQCYREDLLSAIQDVLPDDYYLREGILGESPVAAWFIISRIKRKDFVVGEVLTTNKGEENYGTEERSAKG